MSDIIKICPLGGLDEKGRDCYVVEINDDIFVIDCGIVRPDKTIPGIDFLLPNFDYLVQNKNRLKGYLISHGHDENMSALQYFYNLAPAPIFCSRATRLIMEKQASMHDLKVKFNFVEVKPSDNITISNHHIIFFQTVHNCCYSSGIAIETDRGYVVYTGDFIVDYSLKNQAFRFDVQQLSRIGEKGTFLLMAESKSAERPGYCSPNHRIAYKIEPYFKTDRRLFINCFWQNFFRIYEIIELCKKYRKKIYLYNKYTEEAIKMIMEIEPSLISRDNIISRDDFLRIRKEDCVILILGRNEDLYTEISAIVEGTNEDKRISFTKGDYFINCAMPTPTLETIATRCIDSVYRTDCEVITISPKELFSMHAKQDDLKFFLSVLKPKYYLPIRGTYVNMVANAKLALSIGIDLNHSNVFIIDNGMEIVFDNNPRPTIIPNEVNNIPIAPILVDGKGISSIGAEIIEDRRRLGRDGVVIVAGTVSLSKGCIIAGPDCQMRGFVYVKEAEPLLKAITALFVEEVNAAFGAGEVKDIKELELSIKEKIKRLIKRENGRDPLVHPIIITIE